MPEEYEDPKVHEDVITVSLSELLQEFGLVNTPLLLKGRIPDIYTVIDGIRVIIEVKEKGEEEALEKQLRTRLEENMCELAVGALYPKRVAESPLAPPTAEEVKNRLLQAKLDIIALAPTLNGLKFLIKGEPYFVHQLPGLLRRLSHEALPDKEVKEAVERIKRGIDIFVQGINELNPEHVKEIARTIKEVLESVG